MQASEWKFTYISNERSLVSIKSVECRALRGPRGGEGVPEPHVESNKEPNETNTSHSGIRLLYLCLAKKIETVTQNGCNYNQG